MKEFFEAEFYIQPVQKPRMSFAGLQRDIRVAIEAVQGGSVQFPELDWARIEEGIGFQWLKDGRLLVFVPVEVHQQQDLLEIRSRRGRRRGPYGPLARNDEALQSAMDQFAAKVELSAEAFTELRTILTNSSNLEKDIASLACRRSIDPEVFLAFLASSQGSLEVNAGGRQSFFPHPQVRRRVAGPSQPVSRLVPRSRGHLQSVKLSAKRQDREKSRWRPYEFSTPIRRLAALLDAARRLEIPFDAVVAPSTLVRPGLRSIDEIATIQDIAALTRAVVHALTTAPEGYRSDPQADLFGESRMD